MKKLLVLCALLYQSSATALPFAEFRVVYFEEPATGTYIYRIDRLTNVGPIVENVATEADHVVFDRQTNTFYPAGGVLLNDDEKIFQFGVDTLNDEVVITNVSNGVVRRNGQRGDSVSPFIGRAMDGFYDSDNDGINNKIIMWQLPNEPGSMVDALQIGDSVEWVMFTADRKLENFDIWVHGSDDDQQWSDGLVLHGDYGHYDVTAGVYLTSKLERGVIPILNRRRR